MRAKHIARNIQAKGAVVKLGYSTENGGEGAKDGSVGDGGRKQSDGGWVGQAAKKRKTGVTSVRGQQKARAEHILQEHVGKMSDNIGSLSQVLTEQAMDIAAVCSMVNEEVTDNSKPTSAMIAQMCTMLQGMINDKGGLTMEQT